MDTPVRLIDVQADFVNEMNETWKRILDLHEDPATLPKLGWTAALNDSEWDNLEKRCLEVMTQEELCLYEIYTRYTKSLRTITIITNALFQEDLSQAEVDDDLAPIRVLATLKYVIEENISKRKKDQQLSNLWYRIIYFESCQFAATVNRQALPPPIPAHLGYVSDASDSETGSTNGSGSDSASSSSGDSITTTTRQDSLSSLIGLQPCNCCDYCANEWKFRFCPFGSLTDQEREGIMTIFERKRSTANQLPLDYLREEKSVYRLCARAMVKLEGTLNYVECEEYFDGLLDVTDLEIFEERLAPAGV